MKRKCVFSSNVAFHGDIVFSSSSLHKIPIPLVSRYADVVAVTMADGKKYSVDLFEEGCRRVTPINVQYKAEKETEWQV